MLPGVPGDGQGKRGADRRGVRTLLCNRLIVLGHRLLVGVAVSDQAGDRRIKEGEESGIVGEVEGGDNLGGVEGIKGVM